MQSKSLSSVTTEEQICQIWKVASTGQFSRPDPERQTHWEHMKWIKLLVTSFIV